MKTDLKFGKYLIKHVPLVEYNGLFGTTLKTDMIVADITDYMEKNELTTFDYEEWHDGNE